MASAAPFVALVTAVAIIANVSGHPQVSSWDTILASRIVFAVDTSTSMMMDDLHIKMRQAIEIWTKYLSPINTSISISQLKHKDGLLMKNVAGANLKSILPEEDFFGNACLFCGLKEAAKVLEDSSAQDLVVLLMEERADDTPQDTPQFALQSVQPRFRIFSVALTEKADPDLEELSNATHGASDYIKIPTFARLLMTFASLPVAKGYSIITTKECSGDYVNCPIEFELNDNAVSHKSVLDVFICPTGNASFSLDYDLMNADLDDGDSVQSFNPELASETGCWVYQHDTPHSGIYQLKLKSENASLSVIVVLQNEHYHKLECYTYNASGEIHVKAKVDPPIEDVERFDVSYVIEAGDQIFEPISMEAEGLGMYSACLKPTGEIGRHAVSCRASKSGLTLLTSQGHSFKIQSWDENRDYCKKSTPPPTTEAFTSSAAPPVMVVKDENLWLPEEPTSTVEAATEKSQEESEVDVLEEKGNISRVILDSPANATDVEQAGPKISGDSIQLILFIVGGIILAEVVFVLVRCRRKANRNERERTQVAYPVDPKSNPDRMYHRVGSVEAEETV
ncbi:uncharacterized protein LOC132205140 [Neocloeon triangulifer]|uniref:uncharacterized protein LOC132205140 n=1 Tax=Neocloeon triangulifer TaxID=2078957 RepID=UPI00286EF74F|nr:uncharacterized protein LOC132205140 [Neocloeon triangulifer]